MLDKLFLQKIGFLPKEGVEGILYKKYSSYSIEVDFKNNTIHYGGLIVFNDTEKTIQNITKPEDWVVLECVDRLLIKGYKPKDIILEKSWKTGHGTSGRIDILIKKEGKAYLMIECKTWGKEFEKEFQKIQKDGGQLFTYFQQDKNTEYLMLYTSRIQNEKIEYKNEIVKIEDHYRAASNVEDVYIRWNKLTNQNGIFENWVNAYNFQNKLLTKENLDPLTEDDSSFIFHEFLSILRKYSVSDKSNAFNKIFNLFLAKIYDEKKRKDDELDFQWKEKSDNPVDFQIRLINLHKEGMLEFLKKEIEGIEDSDFNQNLSDTELQKKKKKWLKFNNVFAIKDVIDDESFDDNQRVLKEVVELLQKYQIRYPRKQQHLSDFFERLLTTGLKQESGQFFTPPPIARYIIKSLPVKEYIKENLNSPAAKLPAVIDYAVGSGHFITEMMEEYQNIINTLDTDGFYPDAIKETQTWKQNQYSWASKYIYGVEKDYRLVKVAKVGCYFYGDGLAQVIHGDGLDSFQNSKSYVGLLKQHTTNQDNEKFSFVISNPPYSVTSFKGDIKNTEVETGFELYKYLTDQSSEIECLFIERTKQLLKEDGIAGIILPSSILSNTGIYTKTREIILKYFQIIGITKLGSSTFMATGTNTVVLFLKRRNSDDWQNIQNSVDKFFTNFQDITVNGIENIFSKYVAHVWGEINFSDYVSLCQESPNNNVKEHEIYQEYRKKIKVKKGENEHKALIRIEKEKLLYFILVYKQRVVFTKTGEKKAEKQFLGYEFSNRRGHEGIHPIKRSKSIDECTKLFDANTQENPEKASYYIYKNFLGENNFEISESLQENISQIDLVDMLTFDRIDFEKNISLSVKKKIKIESKWDIVEIGNISTTQYGFTEKAEDTGEVRYLRITDLNNNGTIKQNNEKVYINPSVDTKKQFLLKNNDIVIARSGSVGKSAIYKSDQYEKMIFASYLIRVSSNLEKVLPQYLFYFTQTKHYWDQVEANSVTVSQPNLNAEKIKKFKIPLPPKDVQEKIVKETETLEEDEKQAIKKIDHLQQEIENIIGNTSVSLAKLEDITTKIGSGSTPRGGEGSYQSSGISLIRSQNIYDHAFVEKGLAFINEEQAEKLNGVTVKTDDILFNITGASIARCYIVEDKYLPARVNQHVSIIRTNEKALPKYVQMILVSSEYKNKLLQIGEGATSRQAITKSQLEEFKIPLPTILEQEKIVSEIEKNERKISGLEKQIKLMREEKEWVLEKYL